MCLRLNQSFLYLQVSHQHLKSRNHNFKVAFFNSASWIKHTDYQVFLFHVTFLISHSGKNLNTFGFPNWKPNRRGLSYPSCKNTPRKSGCNVCGSMSSFKTRTGIVLHTGLYIPPQCQTAEVNIQWRWWIDSGD